VYLSQRIDTVCSSNLLELIFFYLHYLGITLVDSVLIKPDNYHPLLLININLLFATFIQNYLYSYRKFSYGDYTLLYNILSIFDWSCVNGTTPFDFTVACLNATVQNTMEQAISREIVNANWKYRHWYFGSLGIILRKGIVFTDVNKRRSLFQ
jgi:hypothetical protein